MTWKRLALERELAALSVEITEGIGYNIGKSSYKSGHGSLRKLHFLLCFEL
jgi:hypothetical protein